MQGNVARFLFFFRADALITHGQRRIHDAIGEGFPTFDPHTGEGIVSRNQNRVVVQAIHVFRDDRRIKHAGLIIQNQRRDSTQRVDPSH